jgi:hypothetical protein
MSSKWGVQGGARSPLVEAPQAPDLEARGASRDLEMEIK